MRCTNLPRPSLTELTPPRKTETRGYSLDYINTTKQPSALEIASDSTVFTQEMNCTQSIAVKSDSTLEAYEQLREFVILLAD